MKVISMQVGTVKFYNDQKGYGFIQPEDGSKEVWNAEDSREGAFEDIEQWALNCRFSDCGHKTEPGCAVLSAIAQGSLSAERLAEYHTRASSTR